MRGLLLLNGDRSAPITIAEADPDVRLIALTSPRHRHRYAPDTPVAVVDDLADLKAAREAVTALLAEHHIDAVVAATEHSVQTAGYLADLFGFRGIGFATANLLSNKLAMKDRLRAAGLPHAAYARLDRVDDLPTLIERLGPDMILKPALGSGAQGAVRVFGGSVPSAVETLMGGPGPFIAERLLAVRAEYHCDAAVVNGEVVFASVGRYRTPLIESQRGAVIAGVLLPPESAVAAAVTQLHERVVAALGLQTGVTHLEAFDVDGQLVVGEIACRPGGGPITRAIHRCYAVDLWRVFIELAVGRAPLLPTEPGRPHVVWLMLPAAGGTVESIVSAGRLRTIPGVLDAEVTSAATQVLAPPQYSTSSVGTVVARVDSESEAPGMIDRVLAAYREDTTIRPEPSGESAEGA